MKPLAVITDGIGIAEQNPLTGDWLVYPHGKKGPAPYVVESKPEARKLLKELTREH